MNISDDSNSEQGILGVYTYLDYSIRGHCDESKGLCDQNFICSLCFAVIWILVFVAYVEKRWLFGCLWRCDLDVRCVCLRLTMWLQANRQDSYRQIPLCTNQIVVRTQHGIIPVTDVPIIFSSLCNASACYLAFILLNINALKALLLWPGRKLSRIRYWRPNFPLSYFFRKS